VLAVPYYAWPGSASAKTQQEWLRQQLLQAFEDGDAPRGRDAG
jgi:hypothetical protein